MSLSQKIICTSISDLPSVVSQLLQLFDNRKIILLQGAMGAGKTTLIKELCKQLGVTGGITSPTFSLVNEYKTNSGQTIYHFDFYRIKNEVEAFDIGCEEYFYSGNLCFIEWPEKIRNLIPSDSITVKIEEGDGKRFFEICYH